MMAGRALEGGKTFIVHSTPSQELLHAVAIRIDESISVILYR